VSRARRRRGLGAALAAAGLVLLAGCGSSSAAAPDGRAGRHSQPPGPPLLLDRCPDATAPAGGTGTGSADPGRTGSVGSDRTTGSETGTGAELPGLTLSCLANGDAVDLRLLRGRPTVLNLWASWCQPCRTELPAFQRLYAAAGDRVRVLGVVTQDNADPAKRLAAALGLRFPSVLDPGSKLQKALGRPVVPMTVVLRSDGRVATVYSGRPLDWTALAALVHEQLGIALR
jgi:thiol-disulfide isomerase/thioredoxin